MPSNTWLLGEGWVSGFPINSEAFALLMRQQMPSLQGYRQAHMAGPLGQGLQRTGLETVAEDPLPLHQKHPPSLISEPGTSPAFPGCPRPSFPNELLSQAKSPGETRDVPQGPCSKVICPPFTERPAGGQTLPTKGP